MSHQPKEKNEKALKVFIADSQPMTRHGLAQLIANDDNLNLVGEFGDVTECFNSIETAKPALVITDIFLKGNLGGLHLTKNIKVHYPSIFVLITSAYNEYFYAERALKAGASGYLLKQEPIDRVLEAIHKIAQGEFFISESIKDELLQKMILKEGHPDSDLPVSHLTDREFEVMKLVASGRKSREIAEELHVSIKTIESHYANIKHKLKLKNSFQLIHHATIFFANDV